LGVRGAALYDDLQDLEGSMVETAVEASPRETSVAGSCGAKDTDESGTNSPTDGVTDMQTLPRLSDDPSNSLSVIFRLFYYFCAFEDNC